VPNGLTDVSNGSFVGKTDLGDGYTRWDWAVHYPINSYNVSMNVGDYAHFTDTYQGHDVELLRAVRQLPKAQAQFGQAKGMLAAYEHYFGTTLQERRLQARRGEQRGMEHQSAVTTATASRTATAAETDRRRHQPAVRLHHHPRERTRMVRTTPSRRRPFRHVDPQAGPRI
jgi:aminopeptidase N